MKINFNNIFKKIIKSQQNDILATWIAQMPQRKSAAVAWASTTSWLLKFDFKYLFQRCDEHKNIRRMNDFRYHLMMYVII